MEYVHKDSYVPKASNVSSESQTEPSLSYTVTELFQRMAQGLPLANTIIPTYYDDNEDIDNPDPTQRPGFDLSDYTREMAEIEAKRRDFEPIANQPSEAKKDEATGEQ